MPKPCNLSWQKSTQIVSYMLLFSIFNGGRNSQYFVAVDLHREYFSLGKMPCRQS
jgi:hypothetical protein